jgi:hypothetical protein
MSLRSLQPLRNASAALLLAGILSVAATAKTAQDYFHGAAGKYVAARHQEAMIELEEGLRRHPDDPTLKSLKTQLDRLKDQQRQDQGSQGSSGGDQGDQKQDKQEGSQDQGGNEEKEKEEEKQEEQSGKQDEGKEDVGKGASQGEEEPKKDDPESPEQAAAPVKPGEMSKEDAERLLNSIQDDEKREHRNMQRRHRDKVRVEQDW